jgi:putative glycosyltransferase
MELSIVTTMYYSSPYLNEFYERITKEAEKITNDYEIIFVDDGSPDDSLDKAVKIQKNDSKVKVIELSRNFGHHKAIMTGLSHANGEYIFLIDIDLEEEPELLSKFWNEINSHNNIDAVYGVQEIRKGKIFERWSGNLFYKIFNKLTSVKIPKNLVTCRLTNKKYNEALISFKEQEIFLAGLWVLLGFKQLPIKIKKHSYSKTTYSFSKKVSITLNAIFSFSNTPLKFIFYLGISISIISSLYIFYLLFNKFFYNIAITGWTSIVISIWFLGGLIIFSLGIIGIYLSKIFIETKNRPYTIIKEIYETKI